ncbi:DNA cytosine methyltransferase [Pseudoalteromonas aliena]|uniref:DNA (cytosine-5-)-methyltransferase n=1 Tax=Pseudoalteromonas aliena SW19 TaxID=1314866 RepID=A0ABR9DY09_9GAMM|nr:DNA cytosine methyltransferase [Pseudoalteromonas aliena]MBE0359236.1 DNA (cytosine-5)-methyltransferase 1 [Pseudoalteromonas aliena SW19]
MYECSVVNFDYTAIDADIDLISGGPPCQPFSLGGKAKGNEDSRDMFPQVIRAIREKRPKAFIFENVKGLMRKSFSDYFEYITLQPQYPSLNKAIDEPWRLHKSRLDHYHAQSDHMQLEYKVTCKLVNAADYGIPQKRERIFLLAFERILTKTGGFLNRVTQKNL